MTEQYKEEKEDFFSLYLDYTSKNECPTFFHRWTAITTLAAYLGRDIHFKYGHFNLHANMYTMLVGSPGTKKSSAIKIGAKLIKLAGYKNFGAKKTRQEKFLLDLAELSEGGDSAEDILDANLWGASTDTRPPAECFVAADEFNNFIGVGNLEFMSILGELWDYEGTYDYKLKNSKSIHIPDPTITILGGNTPTNLNLAFPPEAIGQGFFSRLLFIYGEPSGVKYTFPHPPDEALQLRLIERLHGIKQTMIGEVTMNSEAMELLDDIYHKWEEIDDVRFEHYTNRRIIHLIKLCMVVAASRMTKVIGKSEVIYANTLLTFTEQLMPKALGEFGKARNSDVTHKIMQLLDATAVPLSFQQLWKHVHADLDKREQLVEIIGNLDMADKLSSVKEGAYRGCFLPIKQLRKEALKDSVDWSILTDSERGLL
jgi:hypothetical protein